MIYQHRNEYPVAVMCRFCRVSRSGYYDFVHRMDRPEKDTALAEIIAERRERSFHTYAMLIAQGVDVRTVAGLLGHSQPSTTLDIYSHAFDKNKRLAGQKLSEVMGL